MTRPKRTRQQSNLSQQQTSPPKRTRSASTRTRNTAVKESSSSFLTSLSSVSDDHEDGNDQEDVDIDDYDDDDDSVQDPDVIEDEVTDGNATDDSSVLDDVDDDDDDNSEYDQHGPSSKPKPTSRSRSKPAFNSNSNTNHRSSKNSFKVSSDKNMFENAPDDENVVVVMKKPSLAKSKLDDHGIPYRPDRIHPNTIKFLANLKKNNERGWFKAHDLEFRTASDDFSSFVQCISDEMLEVDDTLPELPLKDTLYRIYRDTRFSKDPTPYKTYLQAGWSRTGKKGYYAFYFLILSGGATFIAGGVENPENDQLLALRQAIQNDPKEFKKNIMYPELHKHFYGGVSHLTEKAAVKEFARQNSEKALKSAPKGFAKNHPDIELLKLKTFVLNSSPIPENQLTLKKVVEVLGSLKQFITYLNSIVKPDPEEMNEY